MIAIVDYGVGNLFSLQASIRELGYPVTVTDDAGQLRKADHLILPGVGAFGDAMEKLRQTRLIPTLDELAHSGVPFLGICLGMQLLFDESSEFGLHEGLHYIRGVVSPLKAVIPPAMKVPHMGWNSLKFHRPQDPILSRIREGDYVYYVHSFYACNCEDALIASSNYHVDVPGIVRSGNIYGTQFHPEKSGSVGLKILDSFLQWDGQ
ncbi:MAG: imidazole glycerol phosphate synthase subunit HisH [Clostridia bacterium]|nr:imidazole glycerol phosphate synthase subunit HisH [Clostridia bacterium]